MPIDRTALSYLLNRVEKPGRYIGKEIGTFLPEKDCRLRMVLAFPDIYEIGMSNLGIRILYNRINKTPGFSCERVFSPWIDLEKLLRKENIPLFSLETHSFLNEFDAVGISMQTELSIMNALNIIDLGNIPVLCSERRKGDYPFVFCGGQGIINPEPYADFFDFFFLGEADNKVMDLLDILALKIGKPAVLKRLAKIKGVYIPSLYKPVYINGVYSETKPAENNLPGPVSFYESDVPDSIELNRLLPNIKPVHYRAVIEAARGCANGCRFCQSGYISRPFRPKSSSRLIEELKKLLEYEFYESITLLSLNIEDYPAIEQLLPVIIELTRKRNINISLPSLRASMLDDKLAEYMSAVRKSGFTIAPEAGSQKLRDIINKNISEDDIINASMYAYSNEWDLIKCYFMIGLPGEEDSDIDDIIKLSNRISRTGSRVRNRSGRLNIGLSPFVPKAFTPFQWAPFVNEQELAEKISHIKHNIGNKKIKIKENSPYMAFAEALLSTGDRRLGEVIYDIFNKGERFCNWSDFFSFDRWKGSIKEKGYPFKEIYREKDISSPLPYDHIDAGITKNFLCREWLKAKKAMLTSKCSADLCNDCGIGDSSKCYNYKEEEIRSDLPAAEIREEKSLKPCKLRLIYRKEGLARFIGNIDTVEAIRRMLKIRRFPVQYSRGFNPSPVYSVLPPLPVGMEGINEIFDINLTHSIDHDIQELNSWLPEGIRIKSSYITDKYDMLLKDINQYIIGIETAAFSYEDFTGIMKSYPDISDTVFEEIRGYDWGFSFRAFFKKDRPFSLRRFYDYITGYINDESRVVRICSINKKEGTFIGQ